MTTAHIVIADLGTTWLIIGVFMRVEDAETYAKARQGWPGFRRVSVVSRSVEI